MPRPRDDYEDDEDDRPRRPRRRPEESADDDEDDRPRRRKPANTATTVVLALAGTAVASLLVCGGVALYIYRSVARGVDEAKQGLEQKMQADLQRMREEGEREQARRKAEEERSDRTQATRLAERFMAELKGERPEAAYKLTTADYQKRVPPAEFQTLTALLAGPDARGLNVRPEFGAGPAGEVFVFDGTFGPGHTVKLTAVKDGDGWKVDRLSVTRKEPGR